MQAWFLTGPGALELRDVPDPQPGPHEAVVRVEVAWDRLAAQGHDGGVDVLRLDERVAPAGAAARPTRRRNTATSRPMPAGGTKSGSAVETDTRWRVTVFPVVQSNHRTA